MVFVPAAPQPTECLEEATLTCISLPEQQNRCTILVKRLHKDEGCSRDSMKLLTRPREGNASFGTGLDHISMPLGSA